VCWGLCLEGVEEAVEKGVIDKKMAVFGRHCGCSSRPM